MNNATQDPSMGAVVSRLWRMSVKRHVLALTVLIEIAGTVAMVYAARWMGMIVENAVHFDQVQLIRAIIIFGIFSVAEMVCQYCTRRARTWTREHIAIRFRSYTSRQVAGATIAWNNSQRMGDLLSRVQQDIREAILMVTETVPNMIAQVAQLVISGAFMFAMDWRVSLGFFAILPVLIPFQLWASTIVQKPMQQAMEREGETIAQVQDLINNRTTVKAYRLHSYARTRLRGFLKRRFDATMRVWQRLVLSAGSALIISPLPIIIMCGVGGVLAQRGQITLATFSAMLVIATPVGQMLIPLAERFGDTRRSIAASARIFPLWDAPQESLAGDMAQQPVLSPQQPVLSFEHVSFTYPGEDHGKPILQDFSLDIQPGESVALAGPSGCGKSTVLKLAMALYRPDDGQISAYGAPYTAWGLEALRAQCAMVSQDTYLFPCSIGKNIAYGAGAGLESISAQRLEEVCRAAELWSFIESLPEGLDTLVGERGVKLSGGQRQRVAIARALLREAPLLILDEATSSLDVATEKEVQRTLDRLMQHKSALIVAHRLSTIQNVDRIVVMDDGHIVEQGTHAQLLAANGLYSRLYRSQTEQEAS